MKRIVFAFASVATLALLAGGCGGPGLVPVEGVVRLDGKPLPEAAVRLDRATGALSERVYVGETDTQGHFVIRPVESDRSGAVPDTYRVFITSVKVPPGANELTKLPPERVPLRWRDGSESFVVPAGGTTEANFAMTSR